MPVRVWPRAPFEQRNPMFQMPLSALICYIKKAINHNQAILMEFDVKLSVFSPPAHTTNRFSILLYCPDEGRTHTFTKINDQQWKNTSNHDTCWRTDGIDSPLSALYFTMADDVNNELSSSNYLPVAPKDMHSSVYPVDKLWKMVDIKLKREATGYSFEIIQ